MTTNRFSENGTMDQWQGLTGGTNHLGQMIRKRRGANREEHKGKEDVGLEQGWRCTWCVEIHIL